MSKTKDQFNVTEIAESDNISCSIQSLMLPCRDGIRLHTVIYFPLNLRKKAPVILRRSPYCQKTSFIPPDGWALKNAVVSIMQSCRGTTTAPVDLVPLLGKGHHHVAVKSFYRHQPFYNFVMVKLITDSGEHTLEFRNQLESDRSQITFELEIR